MVDSTLLLTEVSGLLFTEFFPKEPSLARSGIDHGTSRMVGERSTTVPTKLKLMLMKSG